MGALSGGGAPSGGGALADAHAGPGGAGRAERLEKRLARERQARLSAEEIAEQGLRDFFDKQELLGLLERIATHANLSNSVEATFRFTLDALRRHTGAVLGAVLRLEAEGVETLLPADICDADDTPQLRLFVQAGASLAFGHGEGLPGRVLSSGAAVWISDVTVEPGFVRARAARAAGLRTGFAFPIRVGSQVVAVMEFFQLTVMPPDRALLGLLVQVGVQLGRVVERSRSEERLRFDALHDSLTGLPNRRALMKAMDGEIRTGRPFALLLIDLDRFKEVNDTFGHAVGDSLLRGVAERLRARAGPGECLARLGGDELAILVHGGDEAAAATAAAAVVACLRAPFLLPAANVTIGCSVGFCCADATLNVVQLMQRADVALYEAKRNGRGQVCRYETGMMEAITRRHLLEGDLRLATERGEFHLAYQPVMSLADDRVIGFEALIRWRHPARGIIPPAEFIPLSEQSDLIVTIGEWVLGEACREAATWPGDLHVAVNVSSVQLRSPLLLAHLRAALAGSGLPAHRLEIEVTETALIENGAQVGQVLAAIRGMGVRIALDDFGTGCSSLSHLLVLPFDRIKIDRSFVATALTSQASRAVLKGIIQIGRDMGVATLAEGVETERQRRLLKRIGCDVVQGYLIGRPERTVAGWSMPVPEAPCPQRRWAAPARHGPGHTQVRACEVVRTAAGAPA